jgi:hypothetical protein
MEAADSSETSSPTHHLHYVPPQATGTFVAIVATRTPNFTLSFQYGTVPQYRLENAKLLDENRPAIVALGNMKAK